MSTRLFAAAALALTFACTPVRAEEPDPEPHPVYTQLKAYRNYFTVSATKPMSERFTAWFVNIDYTRVEIGANSPEEIREMEESDLGMSWGSIAMPPPSVDPVPPELQPLADALERRLMELYPDHQDLMIAYEGRYRTIAYEEVTSYSTDEDPQERFCRRSWLTMAQAEGSDVLEPADTLQGFGGMGRLVPYHSPDELPRFVGYVSPPELEGSCLSCARFQEVGGAYQDSWEEFSARLIETADAIEQGTYENPIEAVLAAQGETTLPPGIDPWVEYEIDVYARASDFQNQVGEHPAFRFRLRDVLEGPVAKDFVSAATGLTYRVELDLKARTLALKVETSVGDSLKLEYPVTGEILVTDEGPSVEDAWLDVDPGEDEHSLPGTGGFTEFDVYPDTSVRTTRIFREEVSHPDPES